MIDLILKKLAKTSHQAWLKLTKFYASCSRSRILHLKGKLSSTTHGDKFVLKFLQALKSLYDQLTFCYATSNEKDLIVHAINGLEKEYKEVMASIQSRGTPISFEELHD